MVHWALHTTLLGIRQPNSTQRSQTSQEPASLAVVPRQQVQMRARRPDSTPGRGNPDLVVCYCRGRPPSSEPAIRISDISLLRLGIPSGRRGPVWNTKECSHLGWKESCSCSLVSANAMECSFFSELVPICVSEAMLLLVQPTPKERLGPKWQVRVARRFRPSLFDHRLRGIGCIKIRSSTSFKRSLDTQHS